MIMGVERKWAPTMMKLEEEDKSSSGAQASTKIAESFGIKPLR
jgi:hypothetical protein